jgi:hypothetical protein
VSTERLAALEEERRVREEEAQALRKAEADRLAAEEELRFVSLRLHCMGWPRSIVPARARAPAMRLFTPISGTAVSQAAPSFRT